MSYQIDESKYLNEVESRAFRARLSRARILRDRAILELSISTGARASEILSIRKSDLNPADKSIFFIGLKGSNNRRLKLNDELWGLVEAHARETQGEMLFPINLRYFFRIWCKYRPVRKKLHGLRHTFAIELYKKTKDIFLVKMALGHKSIRNTMVYLEHIEREEKLKELVC